MTSRCFDPKIVLMTYASAFSSRDVDGEYGIGLMGANPGVDSLVDMLNLYAVPLSGAMDT